MKLTAPRGTVRLAIVAAALGLALFLSWRQATANSLVEIRRDVAYAGTDHPNQTLDIFLPKKRNSDKPLPVTVYIHGGGWAAGDKHDYEPQATARAASGDFVGVSIAYRLSREAKWPAQIHDCKAAIRWLRGNSKELAIDPDKIGVIGASAGGHLVSMLGLSGTIKELDGTLGAYTSFPSNVTCAVNYCGPAILYNPLLSADQNTDPSVQALIGGPLKDKFELAKQASPLTYISSKAVPLMMVYGTDDKIVTYHHAVALDQALTAAGASHILITLTGGDHGVNGGPELAHRVQQFVDLHLRGIPSEISSVPIPAVKK